MQYDHERFHAHQSGHDVPCPPEPVHERVEDCQTRTNQHHDNDARADNRPLEHPCHKRIALGDVTERQPDRGADNVDDGDDAN